MDKSEEDPRFAHVASDPRFKPMPKSKKKVKIDSRFQSLFTNKHFSHRMDIDKRGRPTLNSSKKNKSTMERFYEMSSESDESDSDSSEMDNEATKTKEECAITDTDSDCSKHSQKDLNSVKSDKTVKKKEISSPSEVNKKGVHQNENLTQKSKKDLKRKQQLNNRHDKNLAKKKKMTEQYNSENRCSDDSEEAGSDGIEFDEDFEKPELQSSDNDSEEEELPVYSADYDLEETDHQWNELEKDAPMAEDASYRLAVCNMDWDFVKAQDLFVLLHSFAPEGGSVKSVSIYPSEFGKERMAEEVRMGPKEIREHTLRSEEDKTEKKKKGKKIDEKKEKKIKKTKEEIQTEKIREYQLNRLKYYYAVVECDSVKTADTIYSECDGREYQLSSVRLDLRFIPDEMTFDDEPKEVFLGAQTIVDYQPSSFESTALCNAKVDVTWDETEFDRLSRRVGIMQQKDLEGIIENNKYADIIAPPESDSEDEQGRPEWLETALAQASDSEEADDSVQSKKEKVISEEKKIKLYRKLLIDQAAAEEEENEKEENDVDKVMEWTPGLKSDVKKKLKKKEKNSEETAVVNDYLEKRRMKKKNKRNLKKQKNIEEGEGANSDDDDDLDDIDESLKKMMDGEEVYEALNKDKKKKKKKKDRAEARQEEDDDAKAELELILMGDEDTKHFSKPEIIDDNESKSKKKRKSKKAMAKQKRISQGQQMEKEDYVMDVEDKRFGALFSSHHFHIDPTAPQFKKTKNMMRLVDEQIKRKKSGKFKNACVDNVDMNIKIDKSSRSVSQSLVESLKKKMKKP